MKNPCMSFQMTEEFDRILATEIYPAVIKAFGTMRHIEQSNLLCAATDRFVECMAELAFECRDTYLHAKADTAVVDEMKAYLTARDNAAAAV